VDPYAAANVTTADFLAYEVIALVWFAHFATGLQVPDVSAAEYESFGNVVSPASLMRTAEMRGYRFLISVSVKNYPYLYPIRSDVNCCPYPIRIRSIDCDSKKNFSAIFDCRFKTGCQILMPLLAFGTDVDVAYFLMTDFSY